MRLQGKAFPEENFRVLEDDRPNMEIIDAMLKGAGDHNVPAYVVRNFHTVADCNKIKDRFYKIIQETSGGNRVEEFVKVYQIGATQFQKTTPEYFDECDRTRPDVRQLLSVVDEELRDNLLLERSFRNYFQPAGIRFGPSSYQGRSCNLFTARLWNNDKELSLLAHEDLAQLTMAQPDGYEIGNVRNVIAMNLCIENASNARLILWNISPDTETKRSLNLETTGYPYPLESLEGIPYLTLDTSPGDLYFINANFVHAVSKQEVNRRISVGCFLGYTAEDRVGYWT